MIVWRYVDYPVVARRSADVLGAERDLVRQTAVRRELATSRGETAATRRTLSFAGSLAFGAHA